MASAIPSYIKLGVLSANSSIPNPVDFQMPPEVRSCFTSFTPKKNTRKLHHTSGSVWKSTLSDPRSLQTDGLSDKLVPNKSNRFFIMPLSKTAYGQGTYSPLSTSILMTCLGRDVPSLGLSENMAPRNPQVNHHWLVVSTPLKNISQWEGLSHILWKIKMFETTNQINLSLVKLDINWMPHPWGIPTSGDAAQPFCPGSVRSISFLWSLQELRLQLFVLLVLQHHLG